MDLNSLLAEQLKRGASDLHLVVGQPPVFRIDGALVRQEGPAIDEAAMNALLLPTLPEEQQMALAQGRDVDSMLRLEGRVYQLHLFRERGRLAATLRLVPTKIPTIDDLYPESNIRNQLHALIKRPRGLIIVTGPAGSGKTTTCVAMLETINQTTAARIITLEDQISCELTSKQAVITQRIVGQDVSHYHQGVHWAYNQDVDVMFIGEVRDLDTLQYAFALAESGRLVIAPLHVNSASEAIHRVIDVFPQPRDLIARMVARCLVAVVAQQLFPRADKPGRVAANELLLVTPRVGRMIIEGWTDLDLAIEAGREAGMQTMDDSLLELYRNGKISYETAWLHIRDRERLGPYEKHAE